MATTQEFSAIVKALNKVESAAQARAAAGAALKAAGATYKILPQLPDDREMAGRNALDGDRSALESWYRTIAPMSAQASVKETWPKDRRYIERMYITIGGIEAEASYRPQTSNLDILTASLKEAPGLFGEAAGALVNQAGGVVGNAAGGILSGLGVGGTLTLVIVGVVIFLVVTRGTILGMLFKGGG